MRRVKSEEKTFFGSGGVENTGEKTRALCLHAEHSRKGGIVTFPEDEGSFMDPWVPGEVL